MKKRVFGIIVFLLIVISYYAGYLEVPTPRDGVKVIDVVKDSGNISVYFCPRDNCSKELEDFIMSGKEKVYCAFFDLDVPELISALEIQYSRGLDVRLVVDSDNYDIVEKAKIPITQDNRSSFMHNKFCVVDQKVSTGSMNPTINGVEKNNNNLVFVNSDALSSKYEEEFLEFWSGNFGKGAKIKNNIIYVGDSRVEVFFCPDDCKDGEAIERINEIIKGVRHSVRFMTFAFTHESIANALLLRYSDEDLVVSGVFEKRNAGSRYSKQKVLAYQGMDVINDTNGAVMHHKVFIIDNQTVVTGSFNPSNNAQKRNDENIIIINDERIASYFLDEFDRLYKSR